VSNRVGLLGMSGTLVANKGSHPRFVSTNIIGIRRTTRSLEAIGSIAHRLPAEFVISKRKLQQAEAVELVRLNRENATPNLGIRLPAIRIMRAARQASGERRPHA
jgi:hypothetical protein